MARVPADHAWWIITRADGMKLNEMNECGEMVEWKSWQDKTGEILKKSTQTPFRLPRNRHGVTETRTRDPSHSVWPYKSCTAPTSHKLNSIQFKCQSINHSVLPKSRSFTANSVFSTLLSSQPSFSYLHTFHFSWCSLSSDIFFCREPSYRLPLLLEYPSAGSSFLVNGPANFFSYSLSVAALIFALPLFPEQLRFLFCLSILHAPSFSISTSQMLPFIFAHSIIVSKSLHHTMPLHTKHLTSLFLSSFSKDLQKMLLFLLKASFAIAILCLTSWQQLLLILHPMYLK